MRWAKTMLIIHCLLANGCAPSNYGSACWSDVDAAATRTDDRWFYAFTVFSGGKDGVAMTGECNVLRFFDGRGDQLLYYHDFSFPYDLASNDKGDIFVADTGNHVIKKISKYGRVSIYAGQCGQAGFRDGHARDALFLGPCGVDVDRQGCVIVADTGNNAVRKILPDGAVETLLGRAGESQPALLARELEGGKVLETSADGCKSVATLRNPIRVAADTKGNIVILCAALNETHFDNMVRCLTPEGNLMTLAGETHVEAQFADGVGRTARLYRPVDIVVNSRGEIYLLDDGAVRQISPDGKVSTVVGTSSAMEGNKGHKTDGAAVLHLPTCLAIDREDHVYIGDGTSIKRLFSDFSVTNRWEIDKGWER